MILYNTLLLCNDEHGQGGSPLPLTAVSAVFLHRAFIASSPPFDPFARRVRAQHGFGSLCMAAETVLHDPITFCRTTRHRAQHCLKLRSQIHLILSEGG